MVPGNTNGALDIQSVLNGILQPWLKWVQEIEFVGHRRNTIDGLLNNLRYFGMIDGDVFKPKSPVLFPRCFPCSSVADWLKAIVGEQVKQGETSLRS